MAVMELISKIDRMKRTNMLCNACKNAGSGLCASCEDLQYHEFIEEYNCENFYKGYCSRYEDGCFRQCKVAPSVIPTQNNAVQHVESVESVGKPKEDKWIIHKINGIPHTVECSHCHQHYDYEELRLLGRSKGCIDIPHCPNCGAHLKGEGN